jgi:two-component system nitrogen regulation sensor histidine kinase NtrY
MSSRNFYFNIITRVLLIVLLSLLMAYLVVAIQSVRLSIICFLAITGLTFGLISYLNATNKNLRYFFDSVKNDDSSLSFPVDSKNKSLKELYKSMNRVNSQIQQLKIENREREQYFGKILEHIATGILTYNNKGFILHANSSAKRLLSAEVLTHLKQLSRIDEKLYESIKNLKPDERKLISMTTKNGETQLSLKSASFRTGENELIILAVQDIKNELDEKELESWMRLIRVLMHEIMNSIAPITSLSESLTNIYSTGGKPVETEQITNKTISTTLQGLNVIKEQGKGLMAFVESYRKLTRIPKPEKKLFKVSDLLSRIEILNNSMEKLNNCTLSYHLSDPDLEIFGDENLISQVLINLIKNAIEANENNPNGKINIIADTNQDHKPEICISDNGPGISEENLEQIFVPFFTTREKGTGIGLSISKQIIGAHGGSLKVRSIPNIETIFCLSFKG